MVRRLRSALALGAVPLGVAVLLGLAACTGSRPAPGPEAPTAGSAAEPSTDRIRRIDIPRQRTHWRDGGFVEMFPAIRVSVFAGAHTKTSIMLRVPRSGVIRVRRLPEQDRFTLDFPPGSEADRVSFAGFFDDDGRERFTIDDVRGTRIDRSGREWFHVYRPSSGDPFAPLVGYEWPRDDPDLSQQATDVLTELVATTPGALKSDPPGDTSRFRRLNACHACHRHDAAGSTNPRGPLPPWPTDGSGFYVPFAVLVDSSVLSTTSTFHDPNDVDPFVDKSCDAGKLVMRGWRRGHFYECRGGGMPMGTRDVEAGLRAKDPYTLGVCRSRRYLHDHMDDAGRKAFAASFAACGISGQ